MNGSLGEIACNEQVRDVGHVRDLGRLMIALSSRVSRLLICLAALRPDAIDRDQRGRGSWLPSARTAPPNWKGRHRSCYLTKTNPWLRRSQDACVGSEGAPPRAMMRAMSTP